MKMKSFFLFFLLVIVSCEKAFETSFSREGLSLYKELSSTKYFVSKKNLATLLSKEHYQIKARLIQNGSHLELFSHSRASYIGDGVKVKIERKAKDLIVFIGIEGYPNQILLKKESYFEKQSEINWTLEVENGTLYGFRVQIWENFLNRTGFIEKETPWLTAENKIADSLQTGLNFYTKGKGLLWAIKIYKTDLISAYRVPVQEL